MEYFLQMLQFNTTNLSIIFWMLLERFFHQFISNRTKKVITYFVEENINFYQVTYDWRQFWNKTSNMYQYF